MAGMYLIFSKRHRAIMAFRKYQRHIRATRIFLVKLQSCMGVCELLLFFS